MALVSLVSLAILAYQAHAGQFTQRTFPRRLAIQASLPAWVPWAAKAGDKPPTTNEVVQTVGGMQQLRLGSSEVLVSQLGLGTQRWGSADFNAPDEALCHRFLDMATSSGITTLDTAESYPIPSDARLGKGEGTTEEIIGRWLAKGGKGRREKLVVATKITGGSNVNRRNIIAAVDGSCQRLQTDYIDSYLLHWPARYTPQSNWGQSLAYDRSAENQPYYKNFAKFDEIAQTMGELVLQGKIRSYGMCNDK
ncbi:NADP-dependent oxidoreductase domain-containing protein [Pavlovales sp. CCMP2436]|nr:NADP-dependent oxidoreductase domain-containing protein [Pavlovales sp. CCMP2436]